MLRFYIIRQRAPHFLTWKTGETMETIASLKASNYDQWRCQPSGKVLALIELRFSSGRSTAEKTMGQTRFQRWASRPIVAHSDSLRGWQRTLRLEPLECRRLL